MICYWPEVLRICGETFYGLLVAGGVLGVAISSAALLVFIWSVK